LVLRSGNAVVGLENSGFGKVHAADGSTVSRQVERVEKPESN
ncbi:P-type conjugative transfer protein VirB9, partial [Klebsiella pneumoniae]